MHEMSVCLALLDQVRAIAADRQAPRATRIELDIGPLSGVEADLLRNAWPIASAGTIAAGADAARIGRIVAGQQRVILETPLGGERFLEELEDDPLPRIC